MNRNGLAIFVAICLLALCVVGILLATSDNFPGGSSVKIAKTEGIKLSVGMGAKKTMDPEPKTYDDKAAAFLKKVQEDIDAINICFGREDTAGVKEALAVYREDLKNWERETEPKEYAGFYENLYNSYLYFKKAYEGNVNLSNGGTEDIKRLQKELQNAGLSLEKALDIYNKASVDKICK